MNFLSCQMEIKLKKIENKIDKGNVNRKKNARINAGTKAKEAKI